MLACLMCGGELCFLGQLGRLFWFRCRDCGLEISKNKVTLDDCLCLGEDDEEE